MEIISFLFEFFKSIFFFIPKLVKWYKERNLKKIFGSDFPNKFLIIYGEMTTCTSWQLRKPGTSGSFNVSSLVSATAMKSIMYILSFFKKVPQISSDENNKEKLDISYCSIGGLNNLKTRDILESKENIFYNFDLGTKSNIFNKQTQKKFFIDGKYDYGFIIKIIPKSFPNRVCIAVAGLGEWGTSGSAWFLSNKWKTILKLVKNKPFGVLLKVRGGQDESAEIVDYQVSSN
ncbi:hypothetical protein L6274_05745 [Candidatus Parcubacteria bacterium]|nr:hypothetical protein [Candidatus Parcubacteria bacterium]